MLLLVAVAVAVCVIRRVCGRRPFGRDAELDYEVMSDQDWEEEPEGESLSVSTGCLPA